MANQYLDLGDDDDLMQFIMSQVAGLDSNITMDLNLPPIREILPLPGFCIKAKNGSGKKFFINVCYCPEIPSPKELTEDELTEILQSDEPNSYRVPMSISEPHNEKDKKEQDCVCYDVVFNSQFYEKVQGSEMFKQFVLSLCAEGIQNKYSLTFNSDSFVVLQNKRYHGTMRRHLIQERPLIAEMDQCVKSNSKSTCESKTPRYVLRRQPEHGNPQRLIAQVEMPKVESGNSISLSAGKDRIVIFERTQGYSLKFHLPYQIVLNNCSAEYSVSRKLLTVYMPVSVRHLANCI